MSDTLLVKDIWVFPIKSCRGTRLDSSEYGETGLKFDREWMIVEEKTHGFLTARNIGRMILIHPTLTNDTLTIHVPEHNEFAASTHTIPIDPLPTDEKLEDLKIWDSPALDGWSVGTPAIRSALSNFMGRPVLLVKKGVERREAGPEEGWIGALGVDLQYDEVAAVGWADQFPILVVTEASLKDVERKIHEDARPDKSRWSKDGKPFEPERFRGNIVISGAEAWAEDGWAELKFEGATEEVLHVAMRCARCMLPNVDPQSGTRDKVVPDLILRPYREGVFNMFPEKTCFGMNCVPKSSHGIIRVGDKVHVLKSFEKKEDGSFARPEDSLLA